MSQLTLSVPGISCGHCVSAITGEVTGVAGVASVDVDLDTKVVTVEGDAARDAVVAAIEEAGYEVAG